MKISSFYSIILIFKLIQSHTNQDPVKFGSSEYFNDLLLDSKYQYKAEKQGRFLKKTIVESN